MSSWAFPWAQKCQRALQVLVSTTSVWRKRENTPGLNWDTGSQPQLVTNLKPLSFATIPESPCTSLDKSIPPAETNSSWDTLHLCISEYHPASCWGKACPSHLPFFHTQRLPYPCLPVLVLASPLCPVQIYVQCSIPGYTAEGSLTWTQGLLSLTFLPPLYLFPNPRPNCLVQLLSFLISGWANSLPQCVKPGRSFCISH